MKIKAVLALCVAFVLSGCGVVNYEDLPEGRFDGTLIVMWLGEGGQSGDGAFLYLPDPADPLRFYRSAPDGSVAEIQPGMMYTDGGSIPKPAQLFRGFSPWGYAPAYMIHDWIFAARHCLNDGMATAEQEKLSPIKFRESAEVIGEAIKTLIASGRVQENDVAPRVITGVVAGPVSYERWVVRGACQHPLVLPKDARNALRRLRGAPEKMMIRRLPSGRVTRTPVARIVSTIRF